MKSAEILAAIAFIPLVVSLDCFNVANAGKDGVMDCNDFAAIGVTALLIIASFLSLLINPTPIVHEPNDVTQKPEETIIFDKYSSPIQF